MSTLTPTVNLEAMDLVQFVYDVDDDIATVHIAGPRPAISDEVGDAWYLRLAEDGGEVIGVELQGLSRMLLRAPYFASVFVPSMKELGVQLHNSRPSESLSVAGSVRDLPKTAHLIIFMIGEALGMYESMRQELKPPADQFADVNWN